MPDLIHSLFSNAWSLVLIILFFGGSIFVHELGHFLAARWCGLHIDRFSIGFGPKIFGWTRNGIEYRVSWIPLGGYVALPQLADMRGIEGDASSEAENLPPISYTAKMTVAVMGAVFNVLFAFVLATVLWAIKQPVGADEVTTRIGYVAPTITLPDGRHVTSPAAEAGLQVGDRIVAIDGHEATRWEDVSHGVVTGTGREEDGRRRSVFSVQRDGTISDVVVYPQLAGEDRFRRVGISPYFQPVVYRLEPGGIADKAGLKLQDRILEVAGTPVHNTQTVSDIVQRSEGAVDLTVLRSGAKLHLTLPARGSVNAPVSLGVVLAPPSEDVHIDPFTQVSRHVTQAIQTLSSLLHPRSDVGMKDVSGPIEIIYVFHLASQAGIRAVLYLTVLVNISLAIFNLLPIPVLDGGHMLFATIAKIRGRAIPPNVLVTTQSVFMVLLLSMVLYVSYFNVIRVHRLASGPSAASEEAPAAAPEATEPAAP